MSGKGVVYSTVALGGGGIVGSSKEELESPEPPPGDQGEKEMERSPVQRVQGERRCRGGPRLAEDSDGCKCPTVCN